MRRVLTELTRLTGMSFSLRLHGKFYLGPGLKFRRVTFSFKMASANVQSKLFHQFGLAATLLLQLHGLLYVYITYQV